MKRVIYKTEEVFQDLQSEWNDLLECAYVNTVFASFEWKSAWWSVYCPGELWVITFRNDADQLIGIAPWFITESPENGRTVQTIGCIEVTDYLDILVDSEYVSEVYQELTRCLIENHEHYDLLDLCNTPESSPLYTEFPQLLEDHGFEVEVKQQEVCPVIDLPDTWEDYLSNLNKKQRHEIRRKIRRAEGSPAYEVGWYIVDDSHDLQAEIDIFLQLMAASDEQKAEFLQDQYNAEFFKRIVPAMYKNGWLQLMFLTVNDEPIASYLNFDYKDRILVYNSGLNYEEYGNLSGGIVLLSYAIQHAIESEHKHFDFLRGDETYKYRMGGEDTKVFQLLAKYQK